MLNSYWDKDRKEVEQELNRMGINEFHAFEKGYYLAVCTFLEQMVENKSKILDAMLDSEDTHFLRRATAMLAVLDSIEDYWKKRASYLTPKEELHP